jgi:hypothetical protein
MVKRMMARALETDVGELTELCKNTEELKKTYRFNSTNKKRKREREKISNKRFTFKIAVCRFT